MQIYEQKKMCQVSEVYFGQNFSLDRIQRSLNSAALFNEQEYIVADQDVNTPHQYFSNADEAFLRQTSEFLYHFQDRKIMASASCQYKKMPDSVAVRERAPFIKNNPQTISQTTKRQQNN